MLNRHFRSKLPAAAARPYLLPLRAAVNIAATLEFNQVTAVSESDSLLFYQSQNISLHLFRLRKVMPEVDGRADYAVFGQRGMFDGKLSSGFRPDMFARRAQETFPVEPVGSSQSSADYDGFGI